MSIPFDFYKHRALNFAEIYHILYNKFKENMIVSKFAIYNKTSNDCISIHIPRCVFYKTNKHRIIILPVLLLYPNTSHYNILLIDKLKRTVERFEPYNTRDDKDLNKLLKISFSDHGYRFIYNEYKGPQYMEIFEVGITMNCGYWVLLYIENRLCDFESNQKYFLSKWMKSLSKTGFHNVVSQYKLNILNLCIDQVDKILFDQSNISTNIFNRRPLDYYDYFTKAIS